MGSSPSVTSGNKEDRRKPIFFIWCGQQDSICIHLPLGEVDYGVAAVETGGQQMSTGHLH